MNNKHKEDLEAPIVADLRQAGVCVEHLHQLQRKDMHAPAAVPVLIRWLQITPHGNIAAEIATALAMPWAKSEATAEALLERFESAPTSHDWMVAKWTIADVLSDRAIPSQAKRIEALVLDPRHGRSREMLCLALVRSRHPDALKVLSSVVEELPIHALMAMRRLRNPEAVSIAHRFATDKRPAVRQAAKRVLKSLGESP